MFLVVLYSVTLQAMRTHELNIETVHTLRKKLNAAIGIKDLQEVENLIKMHGNIIVDKSGHASSTLPLAYESGDREIIKFIQQCGGRVVQSYNGQMFNFDHQLSQKELKDAYNEHCKIKKTEEELDIEKKARVALMCYNDGGFKYFDQFLAPIATPLREKVLLDIHDRLNYLYTANVQNLEIFQKMILSEPFFENRRLLSLYGYVDILVSLFPSKLQIEKLD